MLCGGKKLPIGVPKPEFGRDQLLAINGMSHRLAHLEVIERLLAVVGRQDDFALGGADDHGEARVLLETIDQLGRLEAREGIDVACQQRAHLRRRILHHLEDDGVELDRAGVAPAGELHQGDRIALLALLEHEGAGADRVLVVGRRRLGAHDAGVAERQVVEQVGVGRLQRDLHRRRIDRLDLVDVGVERLGGHRGVGSEQPIDREFHHRGVERLAVVELHARAQLEDIFLAVLGNRPALGQARRDGAGAIDATQTLEDAGAGDFADGGGGVLGRIEHGRLERHADHQLVLGLRPHLGAEGRRRRNAAGRTQEMAARRMVT